MNNVDRDIRPYIFVEKSSILEYTHGTDVAYARHMYKFMTSSLKYYSIRNLMYNSRDPLTNSAFVCLVALIDTTFLLRLFKS